MVETTATKILYQVGTSRVFAFPIRFISPDDVRCYISVNGNERQLAADEYSVEHKEDYSDGANVTLNINPLPSGATLAIVRECDIVQTVSFPINGKFPSTSNEEALDRLTMICQELAEKLGRTPSTPVTGGLINASDILELLTIANNNSDEAKRLVQQFLSTFAGLTVDSAENLYWNGCRIATKCNLKTILRDLGIAFGTDDGNGGNGGGTPDGPGSGGDTGGSGDGGNNGGNNGGDDNEDNEEEGDDDEVISVDPGEEVEDTVVCDTSNGYVGVRLIQRIFDAKIVTLPGGPSDDGDCKYDYFLSGLLINTDTNEPNDEKFKTGKYYGKLVTLQGYTEKWEDEDGNPVEDCMAPEKPYCNEDGAIVYYDDDTGEDKEITVDSDKIIVEMNRDLNAFLRGDLHSDDLEPVGDYPFPDGWTGYKYWKLYNLTVSPVSSKGEKIRMGVQTTVGGSSGEDSPCSANPADQTFRVSINTTAFLWFPNDDYTGPEPDRVVLVDDTGVRRAFKFYREYCLPGVEGGIVDSWAAIDNCSAYNFTGKRPLPVFAGRVDVTNEKFKGERYDGVIEFTYDGVLFKGDEL